MRFLTRKNKTIYIHIGFMKTGTSAIQSFLKTESLFLRNNGLYFPEINIKAMNHLGFSLLNEIPPYVHHKLDIKKKELYKRLRKEINNSNEENIIISTEAYSLISTDYFLGEKCPLLLKDLLSERNFNFKIIASIRRQDDYLISQFNQHVKTHNFYNLFHGDINQFYVEKKALFDFNTIIKRWENVFGKENIYLNIYDKKQDSVKEFFKVFEVDVPQEKEKKNVNTKMSNKGLQFMNIANKFDVIKNTAQQNYLLVDLIEKKLNELSTPPLPTNLMKKVMLDVKEGNEELSDRYFESNYDWYRDVSYHNQSDDSINIDELSKEEAIQVAVTIWNHFQK